VVEGEVMAIDRGNAKGALLRGMRLEDLQARPNLAHGIVQGQLATIADNGGLVLGERLRRDLNVGIGSIITLMSPQGGGDRPLEPKNDDFTVDASFSVRMQEIDSSYIFMPLDAAQLYFNLEPNQVTGLDLLIANIDDARQLADVSRRLFGPAPQPAGADHAGQREPDDAGLGVPDQSDPGDQGHPDRRQRRHLRQHSRQPLGGGRAIRTSDLARLCLQRSRRRRSKLFHRSPNGRRRY
jgi:hypothetical protein